MEAVAEVVQHRQAKPIIESREAQRSQEAADKSENQDSDMDHEFRSWWETVKYEKSETDKARMYRAFDYARRAAHKLTEGKMQQAANIFVIGGLSVLGQIDVLPHDVSSAVAKGTFIAGGLLAGHGLSHIAERVAKLRENRVLGKTIDRIAHGEQVGIATLDSLARQSTSIISPAEINRFLSDPHINVTKEDKLQLETLSQLLNARIDYLKTSHPHASEDYVAELTTLEQRNLIMDYMLAQVDVQRERRGLPHISRAVMAQIAYSTAGLTAAAGVASLAEKGLSFALSRTSFTGAASPVSRAVGNLADDVVVPATSAAIGKAA